MLRSKNGLANVLMTERWRTQQLRNRQSFHQKLVDDFWRGATSILPHTSYTAKIERHNGEVVKCDVIFSMKHNRMIAECSFDGDDWSLIHQLHADRDLILRISDRDFKAKLTSIQIPGFTYTKGRYTENQRIVGDVKDVKLPWTDDKLSSVAVSGSGFPEFQYDDRSFAWGMIDSADYRNDTMAGKLGASMMSSITMENDDWWVRVAELDPIQSGDEDTHQIIVEKKSGGAHHSEYERFLKRLIPLLRFLFGTTPALSLGVGYSSGVAAWGQIYGSGALVSRNGNWFSKLGQLGPYPREKFKINDLFDGYLSLLQRDSNNQEIFYKLFHHYAVSEHFMSSGLAEMAFNTSFAALEGICKFLLATPMFSSVREQFITGNQGNKIGRFRAKKYKEGMQHVVDETVRAYTNGEYDQLVMPDKNKERHVIDVLNDHRDRNVHLDLDSIDRVSATRNYLLWNASQFVFEFLALCLLMPNGKFDVPNRTVPMTYKVMGKDMLAHLKPGVVKFSKTNRS